MSVEFVEPNSVFGYRDYDQICQANMHEIFAVLQEACADREDHANLPYDTDFAEDHLALSKFDMQFAKLLYGEPLPQSTVSKIGTCILTGQAVLEQLKNHGAATKTDLPTLRDFNPCQGESDKLVELLDGTDRYRRVRPQLNHLLKHYIRDIFSAPADTRYQETGLVVANLVLWCSEDIAYSQFKDSQEQIKKQLKRAKTGKDLFEDFGEA